MEELLLNHFGLAILTFAVSDESPELFWESKEGTSLISPAEYPLQGKQWTYQFYFQHYSPELLWNITLNKSILTRNYRFISPI
ncbi:hypothetical protein TorRG33x02_302040 [Trema orientale]|uniref:Uncharacterized protein n=1 Tax=Trema orientale TaxID=63057 RepID=A0A2P5C0P8_TREOI|nr:hypothetical protein TorRG33x02_302040 [Trema orientale]